ncbi:hypothetical protein MAR_010065 [Mya arenaria]|uniref:Myb/SANT-like DNA-binding domain-containing protein n=1 Tax=Mya arenaria TaxID=6604 RepID=A0ABY7E3V4_MYAAR|nr:hypothetical protein MAR_010065 [Mya arenaria]
MSEEISLRAHLSKSKQALSREYTTVATPQKLKRNENWSRAEHEVVRNSFFDKFHSVESKFSPGITSIDKDKSWEKIEERVDAQGVCITTLDERIKKLSHIKTDVERSQMAGLTGREPPPNNKSIVYGAAARCQISYMCIACSRNVVRALLPDASRVTTVSCSLVGLT